MSRKLRVPIAALAVLAAACSPGGSSGDGFNPADTMFAQMMIPHHEQAIEMAGMALDPATGAGPDVLALAEAIAAAQDPEIAEMTALLEGWGEPVAMDEGMDHSGMMSGMLTVEDLDALAALRGPDFDRAWLEAMIAHHEGAVAMAEDALADGESAEVRDLAERIVAAQAAEIAEMRALLG